MEISFIQTQILVHLPVNKTNFQMHGFAVELALKQRRKATRKSPILYKAETWSDTLICCLFHRVEEGGHL